MASANSAPKYLVLRGLNYGADGRRAEPGEVIDDVPTTLVADLKERRAIELIEGNEAAAAYEDAVARGEEPTKEQLLERAKELDIEGRSSMDKETLASAIAKAESS